MPDYNGYPTLLAYLEAQRQEALELAERGEHEHGEADPIALAWRRRSLQLTQAIEWETDWNRRMG